MKRIMVIAGTVAVAGVVGLGAAAAYADPSQSPSPGPTGTERHPNPPRIPFMPLPGLLPGPLNEVLYGETVAKADDGSIKAFDWQNGQVTGVSGSSVTVRSSDGTTWTWTLTGDTLVRKNKKDGSASDIAAGDKVAIAGTHSGGTRTAARVMDPAPDLSKLRQRLPDLRDRLPRLHEGLRPDLQLRPPA